MSEPLVELIVGSEEGKVVVALREDKTFVKCTSAPDMAAQIGKQIIDEAVKCGAKVTLTLPRKEISGMKRAALVTRCALVMRNQLERGIKPDHLSEQIVDIVLSGAQ